MHQGGCVSIEAVSSNRHNARPRRTGRIIAAGNGILRRNVIRLTATITFTRLEARRCIGSRVIFHVNHAVGDIYVALAAVSATSQEGDNRPIVPAEKAKPLPCHRKWDPWPSGCSRDLATLCSPVTVHWYDYISRSHRSIPCFLLLKQPSTCAFNVYSYISIAFEGCIVFCLNSVLLRIRSWLFKIPMKKSNLK